MKLSLPFAFGALMAVVLSAAGLSVVTPAGCVDQITAPSDPTASQTATATFPDDQDGIAMAPLVGGQLVDRCNNNFYQCIKNYGPGLAPTCRCNTINNFNPACGPSGYGMQCPGSSDNAYPKGLAAVANMDTTPTTLATVASAHASPLDVRKAAARPPGSIIENCVGYCTICMSKCDPLVESDCRHTCACKTIADLGDNCHWAGYTCT